jgi:hypothetical protein
VIAVGNTGPHIVERTVRKGEKGYRRYENGRNSSVLLSVVVYYKSKARAKESI